MKREHPPTFPYGPADHVVIQSDGKGQDTIVKLNGRRLTHLKALTFKAAGRHEKTELTLVLADKTLELKGATVDIDLPLVGEEALRVVMALEEKKSGKGIH